MTDESGIGLADGDAHQHAARQRHRRDRLLRRVHHQHAHRRREPRGRAGDRGGRAGARRARRVGPADADLARRPQRLVLRRTWPGRGDTLPSRSTSAPAPTACRPCSRRRAPTGSLQALTRDGNPVALTTQTIKGIEYAVFDGAAGAYAATYEVDAHRPGRSAPSRPCPAPAAPPPSRGPPTSRPPRASTTAPTAGELDLDGDRRDARPRPTRST